ncbi:MAG: ArsR family transcriptional regulator [Candidatus Methylomirabilis sp.]|nr:ArsR family transcriptional regulator [Deltaproteobacteria bacterium]
MSLSDVLAEHARISILKFLAEAPTRSANDSIVADALETFGLSVPRAQVRDELQWLAREGLVTTRTVANYIVATLTEAGEDVARGRKFVRGVKRPSARP